LHAPPGATVPYKRTDWLGQVPFSSSVTRSPVGGVCFVGGGDEEHATTTHAIKRRCSARAIRNLIGKDDAR
jgi:hypothetical protein